MDKFPLLWESHPVGELVTEPEALYTCFTARGRLPREDLWCAWAVGDRGELRLGVLEPEGDQASIRRRFSRQLTAPLGRLLRGEVRSADQKQNENWEASPQPDRLFHTPWLRQQLRGVTGVLTRTDNGRRYLAMPYDKEKPFPLTPLFCFAEPRRIHGERYMVFCLDQTEWPQFL
jgi:hypothetical protein